MTSHPRIIGYESERRIENLIPLISRFSSPFSERPLIVSVKVVSPIEESFDLSACVGASLVGLIMEMGISFRILSKVD